MKHTILSLGSLLVLSLGFAVEAPQAHAGDPAPRHDIIETAVADGRFEVLAAALKQADLVDTLKGKGPFTVFAPTDEAFAALPQGTVANLLRPENQAALRGLLLSHVVAGQAPSSALLLAASVETASGASFDLGLRVGDARVIQADVRCSNGIIHVVDAVLLPTAKKADKPEAIDPSAVIHAAIEKGAPLYNAGDVKGCADVYMAAAKRLVAAGHKGLGDLALMEMKQTLKDAPADASERAWALRRAFDRALADMAFKPTVEASLPEGFPKPGPVGRVVRKSYPKYRAARSDGGSFWSLFQHIKKNKVEMTAPVEMTMDGDMRMRDMAFLYETANQGKAGTQGSVRVLDLDRVEVLSIGMRGRRSDAGLKTAKALVEQRRKALGLEADGPWRVLGYNSPMVPAAKQYWELQIPVSKR